MKSEIEVLQPGLFSTIQDLGRYGFLKYGVPLSGNMDKYAAKMGSIILNNPVDSAVLEITQMGPKLQFNASAKIVITGADLSPEINKISVSNNTIHLINAGDILSFGKRKSGCRAYLSINGGFKTSESLKSKSWYEGITDFSKLTRGMKLAFESTSFSYHDTHSAVKINSEYLYQKEIDVFPGPEYGLLSVKEKELLASTEFSVDKKNNRMAIQLLEAIENNLSPIITGPVIPGTVQLTPSGSLIILMRDCQTTGGYPRIFQLSDYAMNIISQKVLGDKILFKPDSTYINH
ncbi:biotin-dependent carboxyltransferase family protein [Gillisia limnaea]|uniref:Allophanate hydrolase subunit 2 n=1 Tax=Gillisia limnaea (strain DSM 15749 / LMG 21470 / R-8282) TaxID=865937 RepID=H2BRL3_GILLR|nr:biotin-dependent carboxyltransferase family protein [Gillisia limnaea]EHQ01328.1 Allophanate hydrolase subunit 2 [Gillisia limnaea DSM 15749]